MGVYKPNPTVETVDGTTEVKNVGTIKVSNGDLSVAGRTATVDTSGSGSATLTRYMVGYGDASNQLTGNVDFIFEEDAGSGPKLVLRGDTPKFIMEDDTQTDHYETMFNQSGASMYVYGSKNDADLKEYIRLAHSASSPEIFVNNDKENMDVTIYADTATKYTTWDASTGVVTFEKMKVVITSDDATQPGLQLYETNDDDGAGPRMYFRRDSTTPLAFDDLGYIAWYGSVTTGGGTVSNNKKYSEIYAEIRSPTTDEQSGILRFYNYYLGDNHEYIRLDSKAVNVGYQSTDAIDFKIYNSDSSTHLFFADASANKISYIQYVLNKTDDYSASASDCYGSIITIYHASAKTLTLPTAVKGMHLKCINYGGGGTVAVDANGTETINGSTAQITLSIAFNTADLVCTETGKWVCNVLGVSS
jgi:hypothetical protein